MPSLRAPSTAGWTSPIPGAHSGPRSAPVGGQRAFAEEDREKNGRWGGIPGGPAMLAGGAGMVRSLRRGQVPALPFL